MKPKRCRACHRPMEYALLTWRCQNGDCEQCLEDVRDRKRSRRSRRLFIAGSRRARMRAIREASRLGIMQPLVSMPWDVSDKPWNIDVYNPWRADITLQPWRPWSASISYGRALIAFHLGAPHKDDGSGCLFCDKHCFCDHHGIPF